MRSLEKKSWIVAAACLSLGLGCSNAKDSPAEEALAAQVEQKLDAETGTVAVDVEADGTVVTLSGRVDNGLQKAKAEQLAGEVEGVERVENEIVIALGPKIGDAMTPPEGDGMPPAEAPPATGMIR